MVELLEQRHEFNQHVAVWSSYFARFRGTPATYVVTQKDSKQTCFSPIWLPERLSRVVVQVLSRPTRQRGQLCCNICDLDVRLLPSPAWIHTFPLVLDWVLHQGHGQRLMPRDSFPSHHIPPPRGMQAVLAISLRKYKSFLIRVCGEASIPCPKIACNFVTFASDMESDMVLIGSRVL